MTILMIKKVRYPKLFLRTWKKLRKNYDTAKMTQAIALIVAEDHEMLTRQVKWHTPKGNHAGDCRGLIFGSAPKD
ncbi:hypothetical protein EGT51_08620 [Levilactobacillus suantsaiihabitans]|uniref:Uncharacterized protein n=1 Tax=Levilactobacillus suantsaiihabitans TaxID=2487722 RepID=A0A4Z0J7Y7_9LACO|nr:hypothetical protein EGT51_08620 [Levilactobacillus suantsaiihabitans]